MARNEQVTRVITVIQLLEANPRGFSVRELHERLEQSGISCSPRTIYRDLAAIEAAYFPVTREGTGDEARWKLNSIATVTPSIQFSYRELMALFIARHSLESMKGSPVFDAIESFFLRIEKVLGTRVQEGLKEFDSYLGFKSRPSWQSGVSQEVLDTIHQACAEGHVLEIGYRSVSGESKGEYKTRKVGPETIYFIDSGAYLIAKDLQSGVFKTYSLARVSSAVLLEDVYDRHGKAADEIMKDGFGVFSQGDTEEVIIEISEPIASYVAERRWHDSQSVTRNAGGITLRMQVKVNDELVRWVLGLGPSVTVIKSEQLKQLIGTSAEEILRKYRAGAA